jgi:hypothetical protein
MYQLAICAQIDHAMDHGLSLMASSPGLTALVGLWNGHKQQLVERSLPLLRLPSQDGFVSTYGPEQRAVMQIVLADKVRSVCCVRLVHAVLSKARM